MIHILDGHLLSRPSANVRSVRLALQLFQLLASSAKSYGPVEVLRRGHKVMVRSGSVNCSRSSASDLTTLRAEDFGV